jgi:hypothetical protein
MGWFLPPPAANVRLQPYVLFQEATSTSSNGYKMRQSGIKAGGEVKRAVNPSAVLDLTFNTDFAQADADRVVNNLSRFNALFPERRQFFLETFCIWAGADFFGTNLLLPDGVGSLRSFLFYLVNNETNFTSSPVKNRSVINKIIYLKQF